MRCKLIITSIGLVLTLCAVTQAASEKETELIAILKSDGPKADKALASGARVLALMSKEWFASDDCMKEALAGHAKSRLVSCLEGGYNLEMLAESVQAHLETLLAAN